MTHTNLQYLAYSYEVMQFSECEHGVNVGYWITYSRL